MFSGYDPCYSTHIEDYLNRIDVQKSLHANVSGWIKDRRWSICRWYICAWASLFSIPSSNWIPDITYFHNIVAATQFLTAIMTPYLLFVLFTQSLSRRD